MPAANEAADPIASRMATPVTRLGVTWRDLASQAASGVASGSTVKRVQISRGRPAGTVLDSLTAYASSVAASRGTSRAPVRPPPARDLRRW